MMNYEYPVYSMKVPLVIMSLLFLSFKKWLHIVIRGNNVQNQFKKKMMLKGPMIGSK